MSAKRIRRGKRRLRRGKPLGPPTAAEWVAIKPEPTIKTIDWIERQNACDPQPDDVP